MRHGVASSRLRWTGPAFGPAAAVALAAALALVLVSCTGASSTAPSPTSAGPTDPPPSPTEDVAEEPVDGRIVARPVSAVLDHPAAFTIAPDGTILYGERLTGEIRRLDPETRRDRPFFEIPDVVGELFNEQGLVGLALHPEYPERPYLFAYATRSVAGTIRNEIVRITEQGGEGVAIQTVFRGTVAGERHNGGRILFGPDGMLYAVLGETALPELSQDLDSLGGKVLRLTPSGGVAQDNPFQGSPVFAFGIRNSFGLAFDPQTGELWETENGPECNDEVNHITAGTNYGWGPAASCEGSAPQNTNGDGPQPEPPQLFFAQPIGITGMAFCDGCGLGAGVEGHFLFGSYNTGEIREAGLDPDRTGAKKDRLAYAHDAIVLSIEASPTGELFFSDPKGIYRLSLR